MKALAEKAIDQISDEKWINVALDKESNSIAILIRHLAGNMVSRWTDFLTTDGEKPDRNRDSEFEPAGDLSRLRAIGEMESGLGVFLSSAGVVVREGSR